MLVPDGTEARLAWRVQQWLLYGLVGTLVLLLIGIILFFGFYGTVVSRAARTEQVMRENEDLTRYRYKVQLLEDNLTQAQQFVGQLAELAGVYLQYSPASDSIRYSVLDSW